jgi:hypothetical protein
MMAELLERSFKLTGNIAALLAALLALAAAVTWIAARDAIAIAAPIIAWMFAVCAMLATAVATLAFVVERSEWLATRRAEARRDRTLAKNEAKQSDIASDRAQIHLVAEARMLSATVRQMERGMIHPAALGDGKFSSFPAQIINQIEAHAAPVASAKLPPKIELSQLIPTGPSIEALALGIEVTDSGLKALTSPLAGLVHVGVGGSSGWGKSVFLQCLAIQIALAPELAQMALIDIEGQTFSPFAALGGDRLRYPLADNEADITAILDDLKGEWERRRQLYQRHPSAADLAGYNALAEAPLPPVVMMFDEINMVTDDKDIMGRLTKKYGIFCILGGQDWNAASIPTKLRNNFSTRIQLKAMSKTQSRVMLEDSSAADITDPGRAYAVLPGRGLSEIQTPFITKDDIARALATIPNGAPPTAAPTRIEGQVIACYQATGSYSKAFRTLYELENNEAYVKAIGGNQTAKIKAILDRHNIAHPVK